MKMIKWGIYRPVGNYLGGPNAVILSFESNGRIFTEFLTAQEIKKFIKEASKDVNYAIVSEAGASVYSASKLATEEYPDINVSIRGAISIARRLQDPLAEFVKIDPKSIGVGQYQHDVNQKELNTKLENVTVDLVNKVGVDINSASYKLLSFISGISEKLALNIIEHKEKIKNFKTMTCSFRSVEYRSI